MTSTPEPAPPHNRWHLVRDVVLFQFKLAMDGLRDLLLSPVSIGAALLGLLTDAENPGKYYDQLMHFGRNTDRWINLFGAHTDEPDSPSVDDIVRHAEDLVRREYDKERAVKQRKGQVDSPFGSLEPDLEKNNSGKGP